MEHSTSQRLKSFMTRFKTVMSKIPSVEGESALNALKNGLWHESRFREEMTVNRPPTIEDAIHRASNYAKAEEKRALISKKHNPRKIPSMTPVPAMARTPEMRPY